MPLLSLPCRCRYLVIRVSLVPFVVLIVRPGSEVTTRVLVCTLLVSCRRYSPFQLSLSLLLLGASVQALLDSEHLIRLFKTPVKQSSQSRRRKLWTSILIFSEFTACWFYSLLKDYRSPFLIIYPDMVNRGSVSTRDLLMLLLRPEVWIKDIENLESIVELELLMYFALERPCVHAWKTSNMPHLPSTVHNCFRKLEVCVWLRRTIASLDHRF